MSNLKPIFLTDEELVELGNYLIRNNDIYDMDLNYNGNSYSISKKEDKSGIDSGKYLTISRGDEALKISFIEYWYSFVDNSIDNHGSLYSAAKKEKEYYLSFEFGDSTGFKRIIYKLLNLDNDFSLEEFRSKALSGFGDASTNSVGRSSFYNSVSLQELNSVYLKDELQHVISFINGNKISKDNKKELVKTPNEVAQSNSRKGE